MKTLSEIYDDAKLPIIIVYTQAIIPGYYNGIKRETQKINKNFEYIPIVAKNIYISKTQLLNPKILIDYFQNH